MILDIVIALFIFFVVLPIVIWVCWELLLGIVTHFKELAQVGGILLGILAWGSLATMVHHTRWERFATNAVGFLVCAGALAYVIRVNWPQTKK